MSDFKFCMLLSAIYLSSDMDHDGAIFFGILWIIIGFVIGSFELFGKDKV